MKICEACCSNDCRCPRLETVPPAPRRRYPAHLKVIASTELPAFEIGAVLDLLRRHGGELDLHNCSCLACARGRN